MMSKRGVLRETSISYPLFSGSSMHGVGLDESACYIRLLKSMICTMDKAKYKNHSSVSLAYAIIRDRPRPHMCIFLPFITSCHVNSTYFPSLPTDSTPRQLRSGIINSWQAPAHRHSKIPAAIRAQACATSDLHERLVRSEARVARREGQRITSSPRTKI